MNQKTLETISPILPSLNFDRTIDFYMNVLGDAEVFRNTEYLILTFAHIPMELHFFATKNPKDGEIAGLFLRVNDIAKYHERAISAQGRIIKTLREEAWGQREFCVLDPSGCLLRFGQPVRYQEKSYTI